MSKLLNFKVMDPSCMWARLDGPVGTETLDKQHYDELFKRMNVFYDDVSGDACTAMPASLVVGQVCAVYWSQMKTWCRAWLESIISDSDASYACCYLVDHGEPLVVLFNKIQCVEQEFLQLPFMMRRFHLARVKPLTLQVSVSEKAKLAPSSHWDSSATSYLYHLFKTSSQVEAVVLQDESQSAAIELYISVNGVKICVNDELVAKRFAIYSQDVSDSSKLEQLNIQHFRFPRRGLKAPPWKPPARTASAPVSRTQVETSSTPVIQHAGLRPCDRMPATSQSPECEGGISSKVTDGHVLTGNHSQSDLLEDSDASLATAFNSHLALFRFMRFLNPECTVEAETSASRPEELTQCSPPHSSSSSSTGQEVGPAPEQSDAMKLEDDKWARTRLLEWLNPKSLKFHSDDDECDPVLPINPKICDILVHSSLPTEPFSSLDDAPITDNFRRMLQRKQFCPSPVDLVAWPAVARGNNTVVISPTADQPHGYLAPFLSHMLLSTIFTISSSRVGPLAVVLCPGWEKVHLLCDLLKEGQVSRSLNPAGVLNGGAKDVNIPKDCLLLVTTPFSLVRLLSRHCFLFLRLRHLVLDEADQLFALAPDQMETILQHFQKVISRQEMSSCPQQLVASAKRWTAQMEALIANHMPDACTVIAAPEEAALYGNVQQVVLMTLESSKIATLLSVMDFCPDVGQKTVIICNTAAEVEDVHKAVSSKSGFCMKTHEGLTHTVDFVLQQWAKCIRPGTNVILVITNECLSCLGLTDATCVVHFAFPSSPKTFGSRLFCMSSHFRNLSEPSSTARVSQVCKSLLLVSERNARHVVGLVRYLKRSRAPLPAELLAFAEAAREVQEEDKTDRPFCHYLKSFGVCRFSRCPDRHRLVSQLDQSNLPASGFIEVLPLYVKTASVFCGRIVREEDGVFDRMMADMTSYYADCQPLSEELREGGLYAVQEDQDFHRVKVITVPDAKDRPFFGVLVRFIDVGKEKEVNSCQILRLPDEFRTVPGQAVEMIVCQVKPGDAEADWHPKVTRAVSQKIVGVRHRARAAHSLGNAVFLDIMVRETRVPGMKTVISEYNVPALILNTGMAERNPGHLDQLKALSLTRGNRTSDPPVEPESLQISNLSTIRNKAVEGVKELEVPEHQALPLRQEADEKTNIQSSSHISGTEINQTTNQPPHLNIFEDGDPAGDDRNDEVLVACRADVTKNLHPQVRWYQTSTSLSVTLKLRDPQGQRCDFHPDRAVYSGSVDGRRYRADLDLYAGVLAERCRWELKCGEPVLALVKRECGYWPALLRSKNKFVSYDVDHLEEEDDVSTHSVAFLGDTGEEFHFVDTDSSTDSDSAC
ncbi:putative ATP-dependent RNA helicase TDRD12 isoform X2 [Syngnathoides biaculeatus]|uniref:putative ATP-dependent RNA helicase TDRD12 isoform X2 n=1 Tax=Syngnathoides biaculeatus TaxID=300417 RepID=UPI002ADD6335|nr:putative ATP-dependent RNA helicase TDRD12 isoform X2 [Syngnathoides biaculeatus]